MRARLNYALHCLCGALVVFALNLGGFGTTIARDINKTDEAAYQASPAEQTVQWMGNAPGADEPDAPLPSDRLARTALRSTPQSPAPEQGPPPALPRGPSARAPPSLG
jgi:hypothetical protein